MDVLNGFMTAVKLMSESNFSNKEGGQWAKIYFRHKRNNSSDLWNNHENGWLKNGVGVQLMGLRS
jgi:hypothetical protein